MDALNDLLAIEDIRAVKARYCRLLDGKDWSGFAALFTEDAVMDVREDTGNPPITGIAAIIAQVRFAVDDAATSHQVHTPEITLLSEDAATGVWAMQDRVVWQPGKSPIPGVTSITISLDGQRPPTQSTSIQSVSTSSSTSMDASERRGPLTSM